MTQTMKINDERPGAFASQVLGGRSGWVAIAALFLLLGFARPALGATYEPTRFDDPRPDDCRPANCSLREAVIAANERPGRDTLELSRGTYQLSREEKATDPPTGRFGDLDLVDETRILGAGAGRTELDGGDRTAIGGVLDLHGLSDHTVRDLTIRNGAASAHPGGGIHANNLGGSLSVVRSRVLSSYSASTGGGIFSVAGELTINKSTVAGNLADSEGGGIYLRATGGDGGTSTSIRSSTLSENQTLQGNGAGLSANGTNSGGGFPNPPQVSAVNSTFAKNYAAGSGAGIWAVQGATVSLDNVTVAHNEAETDGAGGGFGGGIGRAASAGPFTIGDVLLAGNTVGATGNGSQCAGVFAGQSGNVVQLQAGTACAISGGLTEPVDAMIGPLAKNGGPTETVALFDAPARRAGSAAIGFAESCPAKDQRGFPRPATDCDSGAFEHQGL